MVAWAKRSIALLALIVIGGLGLGQARADDDTDADLPPVWAPTAYTVEADAPPVGESIIHRGAPAAPAVAKPQPAPRVQRAPRVQPVPKPRVSATFAADPRRRPPARTAYNGQPARVAQAAPPGVMAAPPAEMVEQAPVEVQEDELPLAGANGFQPTDPWCDEYMANGPDALVYSSADWLNNGCWFTSADLVLMNRVNPKSRVMTLDTTSPLEDGLSPSPSMTTADGSFNIAPGARLTVGRFLGRDWANRDQSFEFTFLGLFDWDKSEGTESSAPQRLYTPFDPGFIFIPALAPGGPLRNAIYGGFAAADVQEFDYQTTLNSMELNLRTRYRLGRDMMVAMPDGTWTRQLEPGPTPSFLAGLRYIRINETFNWTSQRFSDPSLGQANLGNATGLYDIQTSNNLFGIQFGGDWTRQEKDYSLGAWIKLAGLVNFAQQESVVVTNDNFFTNVNSNRQAGGEVFTFAGEAGFNGAYHFNPNISLRGGLEMLWIQSVAVATEQISFDFAAPPTVDFAGNVFYMGASIGLNVVW